MTTFDRPTALDLLRLWLIDNIPMAEGTKSGIDNKSTQLTKLQEIRLKFSKRARVPVEWRKQLSARLGLSELEIIRASNTVFEMIDKELAAGGTVRINNFGDLTTVKHISKARGTTKRCAFRATEDWTREINDPIYAEEIGLFYKLTSQNTLTRRTIQAIQF